VSEIVWAEPCPHCERYFTNLSAHASRPCGRATVDVLTMRVPELALDRWAEMFWDRVDRRGPADCWHWLNAKISTGAGNVGVPKPFRAKLGAPKSGLMLAHRIAWVLVNGRPIPDGGVICHTCHAARDCCNPAHLYLGNHHENMNDEAVKHRQRRVVRGSQP
jgi:hypothetical protein